MNLQFSPLDLTGKAVDSVIDGVEFLLVLPNSTLEIAAEHGAFMPFGEASSLRDHGGDGSGDNPEIAALRALHEIQQHTAATVLVPDFSVVTVGEAREWQNVVRILRGETVHDRRLGAVTTAMEQPPEQALDGDNAIAFGADLVVEVGEQRLTLAQQMFHVDAAVIQTDPDDPRQLTITLWQGHPWTRTRARVGPD
jgi:hypothetical protein